MRYIALFALCFQLSAATIVLVRHAEKAGPTGDVPLNEAGYKRSALLAKMLADVKLTEIYTTEFRRTQETAMPIAKATKIQAKIVASSDLEGLVKVLKAAPASDIILVVSHSHRLPEIAAKLGVTIPPIDETEYSRFVVINTGVTPAALLNLRYGD